MGLTMGTVIRKVGRIGRGSTPVVCLPKLWTSLEGVRPGDCLALAFDRNVLIVTPKSHAVDAERVLRLLRTRRR
jgi:hypothetical protein